MNTVTITLSDLTFDAASAVIDFAQSLKTGKPADKSKDKTTKKPVDKSVDKSDKSKKNKGKDLATPVVADGEINASKLTRAARTYAEKFGRDARKQVLNEFGATGITGGNGLDPKDYQQVFDIFHSLELHNAVENADDPNSKGKGKGKGKKKDKDTSLDGFQRVPNKKDKKKAKDKKGKTKKK